MADHLTKTTTKDVILELLDGSGRQVVLYGLKEEDIDFKVSAPKRRSVGRDLLTQQRRVGYRVIRLHFQVFEPLIGSDGRVLLPAAPSVYELKGGSSDPTNTSLTAKAQMDLIHSLAQAHEDGTHIRYRGISVELERAAITAFNANLAYATGRGTLTLEERPEVLIDLRTLPAVPLEAIEDAQESLNATGPVAGSYDDLRERLQTDTSSDIGFLALVKAHIATSKPNPYVPTGVYNLRQDDATLDRFGLNCLPVIVSKRGNVITGQIFPRGRDGAIPTPLVLPLSDVGFIDHNKARLRNSAGSRPGLASYAKDGPSFVVRVENLWIWFLVQQRHTGTWHVEARVYANDAAPVEDYRADTKGQERSDCPVPAPVAITPTGSSKVRPSHVVTTSLEFGNEKELAEGVSFAFVGEGGTNPFEGRTRDTWFGRSKAHDLPVGDEMKQMALVVAVYP